MRRDHQRGTNGQRTGVQGNDEQTEAHRQAEGREEEREAGERRPLTGRRTHARLRSIISMTSRARTLSSRSFALMPSPIIVMQNGHDIAMTSGSVSSA